MIAYDAVVATDAEVAKEELTATLELAANDADNEFIANDADVAVITVAIGATSVTQ